MSTLRCFALALALLSLALLLTAGGCGGGASEEPSVVVKRSESEKGVEGNGAAAPENGAAAGYGTFKGRVVVTGTPAGYPLPPLVAKGQTDVRDAAVCAADNIPDQTIVIDDGGLANVFIYLSQAPASGKEKPVSEPPVFDQQQCTFIPHAMVLRTSRGDEPPSVVVKSSDPVPHNVKTNPLQNREFNRTIEKGGEPIPLQYQRAEQIPLRVECNFHNWMKAWHLPLDHPYGAATKADGSFEITDLPVGTHYFTLWHEKGGTGLGEHIVEITEDGQVVEETIEIEAAKLASFQGPKPRTIKLSMGR